MCKKIPFMLRFSKHSVSFFSTLLARLDWLRRLPGRTIFLFEIVQYWTETRLELTDR